METGKRQLPFYMKTHKLLLSSISSCQLKWFSFFMDLLIAKLIKLAKMVAVMHEADHAYSIQST